jgi:hypothetical protein
MRLAGNNYAFIDSQNVNLGIQKLGWRLSYRKFFLHLQEKYSIKKAYILSDLSPKIRRSIDRLGMAGFELIFKPTRIGADGKIKGMWTPTWC